MSTNQWPSLTYLLQEAKAVIKHQSRNNKEIAAFRCADGAQLEGCTAGTKIMKRMVDGKLQKIEVIRELSDTMPNHKIIVSIDFKATPHIIRHTYIAELILGGVNIKKIQYLASHSKNEETLNIYASDGEMPSRHDWRRHGHIPRLVVAQK